MYTQAGFIHRLSSQHEHAQTNPTEASPDAGWWRRDPRCHCWQPPPAQQMVRPPPPPSRPPSWNVPNKLCQWTVSDVAWCNRDSRGYKRGWKSDLGGLPWFTKKLSYHPAVFTGLRIVGLLFGQKILKARTPESVFFSSFSLSERNQIKLGMRKRLIFRSDRGEVTDMLSPKYSFSKYLVFGIPNTNTKYNYQI